MYILFMLYIVYLDVNVYPCTIDKELIKVGTPF